MQLSSGSRFNKSRDTLSNLEELLALLDRLRDTFDVAAESGDAEMQIRLLKEMVSTAQSIDCVTSRHRGVGRN
jgi:hypothetical protein